MRPLASACTDRGGVVHASNDTLQAHSLRPLAMLLSVAPVRHCRRAASRMEALRRDRSISVRFFFDAVEVTGAILCEPPNGRR